MQNETIRKEIAAIVRRRLDRKEAAPVPWIVQEFMSRHGNISGEDADFYRSTAYAYVKGIAKRVVSKFDHDDAEEMQGNLLEGHEHMRTAYSIERGGEQVLVPLAQCTDEELLERAKSFVKGAQSMRAHAKEIQIYVGSRRIASEIETSDDASKAKA